MRVSLDQLRTVDVNGVSLACREEGHGAPVVLIHGSASDLRTWAHQLPAVAQSHRVIAYSRRYARPNADIPPGVDDQMAVHVDDLAVLLRELDATPAHLVGNSWGAFIALLAAIAHPEMVRSLVLQEPPVLTLFVSSSPKLSELLPLLVRRPRTALAIMRFGAGTIGPAQSAFRRGDHEEGLERFARGALTRQGYERMPEARKQQARENVRALRAQLLGDGFPPLHDPDLRAVRAPVLLMSGQRSPAFFRRLEDRLDELIPDTERIEIPDATHAMNEQNPSAVNGALLDFLTRHS